MRLFSLFFFLFFCPLLFSPVASAAEVEQSFAQWLEAFYPVAAEQGIERTTFDRTFAGITEPDPDVLKKAAYQPEFTTEIWDYLDARITPGSVDNGRIMSRVYSATLAEIQARFGVEAPVVLAIWSMETSYGAALLRSQRLHYVPRALATLAYGDPKRTKFARKQLIAILQIVQAGEIDLGQLTGSWAGAMGHTQFIPTSYLAYGIDMDHNGRRDIWNSVPDALATAANLLYKNGWRPGKSWGYEVRVPAGGGGHEGETKTLDQWQGLGFVRPGGESFPMPEEKAELLLLAGEKGPGFLVMKNFFVLKRYNNSDFYALAVGLLSDRLTGGKGVQQSWPRPADSLSAAEKFELQELLQKHNLYSGAIDGHLGPQTRKAITAFQLQHGLEPDGLPSRDLLQALKR